MKKLLIMLTAALPIHAFGLSGNTLYNLMTSRYAGEQLQAARYLQGLHDAEMLNVAIEELSAGDQRRPTAKRWHWCMPQGATLQQAHDIIKEYLEKNPQDRHIMASQLASTALVQVWRCSDN